MLHSHDFYNIILKIKHELYTDSGSARPPGQGKIVGTPVCNYQKKQTFLTIPIVYKPPPFRMT
jgi:hypothetical protein